MEVAALSAEDIPPPYNPFTSLVNILAIVEVGGWDSLILYFGTDCDMHKRLSMNGFKQKIANISFMYDLATSLRDLKVLYRQMQQLAEAEALEAHVLKELEKEYVDNHLRERKENAVSDEAELNSAEWHALVKTLDNMQHEKQVQKGGRNTWQSRQTGGQGEPYYRDPEGFEKAIQMNIDSGRSVVDEKWGYRGYDLRAVWLNTGDAWRVEHDWDCLATKERKMYPERVFQTSLVFKFHLIYVSASIYINDSGIGKTWSIA
ncbi:MAG: hypothetical protein M1827_003149 [Pycnora praestabilis]|nr:MAG: hypothetical protein M1827_003149 [Pycnora praestabilis]